MTLPAEPHKYVKDEPPSRRKILEETHALLLHERIVVGLNLRHIVGNLETATPTDLSEIACRLRMIGMRLGCWALEWSRVTAELNECEA